MKTQFWLAHSARRGSRYERTLLRFLVALWLRESMLLAQPADAVGAWGNNDFGQSTIPPAAHSGVIAIAAGGGCTAALKVDGSVLVWGDNSAGQTNVPIAARSGLKAVALGYGHVVVLTTHDRVLAWGSNSSGQTNVPAAALTDVRAITAGHEYSVALKQDGTVVAWGANHAGQVTGTFSGNSAPRATASPVKLGGEAVRDVTAIAAGSSHTVAVRGDGSVVAWGRNDNGQVTGTPTGPYPAPAIANPVTLEGHVVKGVVAVAAGGAHTVALKNDGTVVAWGNNYAGQVTGSATSDSPAAIASPVTLGGQVLSEVIAVAAGDGYTVALKSDGTVVAWGDNYSGAVTGISPTAIPQFAIAIPVTMNGQALSGVTAITAGSYHTVTLVRPTVPGIVKQPLNQSVSEWRNAGFEVTASGFPLSYQWRKDGMDLPGANGATYNLMRAQAHDSGSYDVVVSNGLGSVTSAPPAVLTVNPATSGTVVAWGDDYYGQTQLPVVGQSGITAIAAGEEHSVALRYDGLVIAWGANDGGWWGLDHGQAEVPAAGRTRVTAIAGGGRHTVALKDDGTVLAWGKNATGEVTGTPSIVDGAAPVIANPVTLGGEVLREVIAIAAGGGYSGHTVVLTHDGTVSAWGNNYSGQVTGTPSTDNDGSAVANPVILEGQALTGVTAIAAGRDHTVALKGDGTVVAWGASGLTGAGRVALNGQVLDSVTAIAAGGFHTVALKGDGTVVAWGGNGAGQVSGTSTTNPPYSAVANPVNLNGQPLSGVTAIAAGLFHTMALTADGRVTVWGANNADQMSPPTGLTGVTAIAAGGSQCLALINGTRLLPYLTASSVNGELVLSWPTNAAGFSLQSTPRLSPPVTWTNFPHPPTIVGSRFVVTDDSTGAHYYRLIAP